MALWTFVVEFEGHTITCQFEADSLVAAIDQYNQADPFYLGAVPLDEDATQLEGLNNVFCSTGLTEDTEKLILANIVKTDRSQ